MRVRFLSLWLLLAASLLCAIPATSTAAAPRDGYGLFVADDDWDWNNPAALPSLGEDFEKLRPKIFRLQTIWNTMGRPEWQARTHARIARARALGVQQIILTVRSNNPTDVDTAVSGDPGVEDPDDYFPSATQYKARIDQLVQEFAGEVDVWGPANEPNGQWRPDNAAGGPSQLSAARAAEYYVAMDQAVTQYDNASAQVTSVDFLDNYGPSVQAFANYVDAYTAAGGGWGDAVAFHPYRDVIRSATPTLTQFVYTDALAARVPAGKPIWVTEVGAQVNGNVVTHHARVQWIANSLASHSRIAKVAYFDMRGPDGGWNTGLLNSDYTRRPAWYMWCQAAHGNNPSHPDCKAPAAPIAQTASTSTERQRSVTINGSVNPNGFTTSYRFEYGLTPSYGSSAPVPASSIDWKSGTTNVSTTLNGLTPGATYHYRLVATNAGGTHYGAGRSFTTPHAIYFSDEANSKTVSYWSWGANDGWQQTFLYGSQVAAGTRPLALTVDGLPQVYIVDANRGNRITAWGWTPSVGWQRTYLPSAPVAAGSSPTGVVVNGVPNLFYVNAPNHKTLTQLTRQGGTWQETHLFGHAVADNTSPSAVVVDGRPQVYFSDAYHSNTITMWDWQPGWQQTFFYGHPVSPGTSPDAIVVNGVPQIYFSDAYHSNTITMWTRMPHWQQTFLYGHAVASGTNLDAIAHNGTAQVYFVDAYHSNTLSVWNQTPSWQRTSLHGHAVASGSSPSVYLIDGRPQVAFADAYLSDTISLWEWWPGWNQTFLYAHHVAPGTSPSR